MSGMAENGSITLYAKEIFFEVDQEDGMVHVFFRANGMDIRIIQTRHFFLRSAANAQALMPQFDGTASVTSLRA